MRLIVILLFLSALFSCRSSRQSVTDYADTTAVVIDEAVVTYSTDEILSLISSSRELDLSGITIEFFPPDSVHPDSRAAPKSIKIENAKAKETTQQATHEQASVDEQKTINLSAQSSTSVAENTRTDNDILNPADWVVFFSILSAIIIISLIYFIKYRK